MKDYDRKKESSYLKYSDVNNLFRWAISQTFPVDGFKLIENTSQVSKHFIENYNDDSDKGYFLEVDVQYSETYYGLHNDLSFLPERMIIGKLEKLVVSLHDKKEYTHKIFKTHIKS